MVLTSSIPCGCVVTVTDEACFSIRRCDLHCHPRTVKLYLRYDSERILDFSVTLDVENRFVFDRVYSQPEFEALSRPDWPM